MDGFPGRPEHPDFWRLSSAVLKMDGRVSEDEQSIRAATADVIDLDSARYMGDQRARLLLRKLGYAADPALVVLLQSLWLDGCLAGLLTRP